jgi:hypothetical protein
VKVFTHSSSPMILVAILSIGFFIGGTVLEFEAAEHGLKGLLKNLKDHPNLSADLQKYALDFQNERIQRIHQVALAAFDLAKIGLGAVVALATQQIANSQRDVRSEAVG